MGVGWTCFASSGLKARPEGLGQVKEPGEMAGEADRFSIRPAEPEDTCLILEFIRELADYERLAHEVVANEESLAETLFCNPPVARALIAICDGSPAGFALYFFNYSTFLASPGLYLEDLFVRPDFRGRGIGRALLITVARIALKENCGRFEWSVLDWNQPAIDFYRRLGATMHPEWITTRVTERSLEKLAELDIEVS